MGNSLHAALELAGRQMAVFPLQANSKIPACANGCARATTDPAEVRALWAEVDKASRLGFDFDSEEPNVGIEASRSGLLLLDVDHKDGRNGYTALSELEKRHGKLPETLRAKTPNGGLHLYFRKPSGTNCPNVKDHPTLGLGLEVRADNQYLVAPPSQIDGKKYEWIESTEIAECPAWLIELAKSATVRPKPSQSAPSPVAPVAPGYEYSARDVVDRFNASNAIEDVLRRFGYLPGLKHDFYRHPNGDSQDSVHLLGNMSYHFGAGDPLRGRGVGKDNCCFTPFGLVCELQYHGDFKAAVKDFSRQLGMDGKREAELAKVELAAALVATSPPQHFNFDVRRLPEILQQGLRGLSASNPKLSAGNQITLPFAFAGALIGKRKRVDNLRNLYYPNLWVVPMAPSGKNKTGSANILETSIPTTLTVGTAPTCEALFEEIGKSISVKNKSRLDVHREEEAFRHECLADMDGRVLLSDEITGTLQTLIGDKHQNLDNILNLATSGKNISQPRITSGKRVVFDACVSVIGFTQPSSWLEVFDSDKLRAKGFIGRFLPNVDMQLTGVTPGTPADWDDFVAVTTARVKKLDTPSKQKAEALDDFDDALAAWEATETAQVAARRPQDCSRWVDEALPALEALPVYRALGETVGSYLVELKGKIIGHALKLAMICELYDGSAQSHFPACAELVTILFYEFFTQAVAGDELTTQEQRALSLIRQKHTCTMRDVQRKFNLRDVRDAENLTGRLVERGLVVIENGARKSIVLKAVK